VKKIGKGIEDIEMLLMRAMSLGFIRGNIDQVANAVNIEWVQPRVLNLEQISSMGKRFTDWINGVDDVLNEMESHLTPTIGTDLK